MSNLRVYIGHDDREPLATEIAQKTLKRTSGIDAELLQADALQSRGLLYRPIDRRGNLYDLVSGAPMSTEFAISRFLVPILSQSGWALFTDCDVVFMEDISSLLIYADKRFAVQVVQHDYTPTSSVKMDDQAQLKYKRKNWSSVILWNVEHPANRRLTLHDVNTRRGLWLHQFQWLHDSEIGALPAGFNWLVGEQPKPDPLRIAHFTLGGPFTPGWQEREHDDIWWRAAGT